MQHPKSVRSSNCTAIPAVKFVNTGGEELAKSVNNDGGLPPLFESELYELAFAKHYSLQKNDRLRCRWREYVENMQGTKQMPFQLPDVRELRFHNSAIRYLPNESSRIKDHRMRLKCGPGVDKLGQIPIPQEALMKRGVTDKTVKNKRKLQR